MPGARALCSRPAEPGHLTASLGVFWGLFPVHLATGLFGQDDGENQVKQKRTIMDS